MEINIKIINEFEKLVNYIKYTIDLAKKKSDQKLITINTFRLKQITIALQTIKKFPQKISDKNINEFSQLPGIGKGTIDRINEILSTGKLSEIADIDLISTKNTTNKLIEELETIVGVGRSTALDLIKQGVKSVQDLKDKIENKTIIVNDKILLGVKYYDKFFGNIPREEINKVKLLLDKIINSMNKFYKLDDTNKYIFEICGSYRREKPTSGDIDVLISKLGTTQLSVKSDNTNHLERFIKKLKTPIKSNNNQPLLVDDMTNNYETKYMGFAKYKLNPFRRIDIRFVPYDVYHSALLYFTGSAELNLKMRKIAKKLKLKLSEYGLTKEDGTKIHIESEYDVFKILQIPYLAPQFR
jgi:DNA polymerase/3'-5' exonuclease PolX